MASSPVSPMVLVIFDGWGCREDSNGNAISHAKTPVMDSLWETYPHTTINTSGKDVGLPKGQMGNSEVGHLNIGAGRVVRKSWSGFRTLWKTKRFRKTQPYWRSAKRFATRAVSFTWLDFARMGVFTHISII